MMLPLSLPPSWFFFDECPCGFAASQQSDGFGVALMTSEKQHQDLFAELRFLATALSPLLCPRY